MASIQRTDRRLHNNAVRNGSQYRPLELPSLSVGGFCAETRTVCEFFGCMFQGHTCLPFRYLTTLGGETLAERYEKTLDVLQRLTGAGYNVEVVWEFHFDKDIPPRQPEMKQHPKVHHAPHKYSRCPLWGLTEAMVLHYATSVGETIQYYNVMSLHPYVCKYFKFPVTHPKNHVGDACRYK